MQEIKDSVVILLTVGQKETAPFLGAASNSFPALYLFRAGQI
jgi:hypothetical protein